MSNLSIPTALDGYGNQVPIEEAIRGGQEYKCPKCGEALTPRIGPQRQYFAHKRGVLEDKSCPLSSRAGIREMVDELRTSEIEESESQRQIRVYLGEHHGGRVDCFGIIPSLDWGDIASGKDVSKLLAKVTIETSGIKDPPVPSNFHPAESETRFSLEPSDEKFEVDITGPSELNSITGHWTADGLSSGDLFIGDQSRARRHRSDRQVKEGEWVYLITATPPRNVPDVVTKYDFASTTLLAFPAREETASLLEDYGNGLTTDNYGFDADVLLPADAHPTIEAPIFGRQGETVLVGVTPAEGLDPTFEAVPIPKRSGQVSEIEPTGPGNPRFHETSIPLQGSRRFSIHQQTSNRHRMVHLHEIADQNELPDPAGPMGEIGIELSLDEGSIRLLPLGETQTHAFDTGFNPHLLPTVFEYHGPEGLELELTAEFIEEAQFGPTITKFTSEPASVPGDLVHWITHGCHAVCVDFDGVGAVTLEFSQPSLATALDVTEPTAGEGQ